MSKMKIYRSKSILLLAFLCFVYTSLLCSNKVELKRILFFAYYSADTTDGTKTFELNSDGSVIYREGIRDSKVESIEPLKVVNSIKRYKLDECKIEEIEKIIKKLETCGKFIVQEGLYNDVFKVTIKTEIVSIERLMIGTDSRCDEIISDMCEFFDKIEALGW